MPPEVSAATVKCDQIHVLPSTWIKRVGTVLLIAVIMTLLLIAPQFIAPQLAQAERPVASPTAQWIVNTLVDESDGSCSDGDCSLRDAIALAASGDTINFDASLAGQTITLTSQLEISRSLTVDGRGLSAPLALSGNQAVRVIKVITGQVTLAGLTLTHGAATAGTAACLRGYHCGGGLLVNTGAVVTLTDSSVVSNTAASCGGGIQNRGTLWVLNSTIADNFGLCGGGILSGDGESLSTTLVVRDSTFSNNLARSLDIFNGGGAILMGPGRLTVENSAFQNNSAPLDYGGDGGAISANFDSSNRLTMLVRNSLFTHNSAIDGGALFTYGTDLTLEGNLFADNTAQGQGVVCISGNMTVTNNTFSGNTAFAGMLLAWEGVLTMTNNTLSDNATKLYGGLYLASNLTATLRNNILANSGDGPDCWMNPGVDFTITENTNNLIEDGSCSTGGVNFQTGDPRLGQLGDNGGPLAAGHVISTHALLEDSPALDTGNNATCPASDQRNLARPQGAACDRGAYERGPLHLGLHVTPDTEAPYHGLVTYTLVLTNTGAATDPGIWLTDTLPPGVTFADWIISPTGTTRNGDQLLWQGSLPSGVTRTWVFAARNTGELDLPGDYGDTVLNTAQVGSASNVVSWAQAALQVTCGALTVQNYSNDEPCSLRDVIARAPADATIVFRPVLAGKTLLQVYHPQYSWQTPLNGTLLITQNLTVDASALAAPFTLDGNLATRLIHVANPAHLTLNNLTLMHGNGRSIDSNLNDKGGALILRGGTAVTLTHVSVLSNTLDRGTGGGIEVYGSGTTLTILDSILAGNHAGSDGGALSVSPSDLNGPPITVTIRRSTFAGNFGGRGGGISFGQELMQNSAQSLLIEDSLFKDNQAGESGGGIMCFLSLNTPKITIKNSTFSGNVASVGGGIRATYSCPMEISNSTFFSNTTSPRSNYSVGGLISDAPLTVTNSTFSGNSGGIYNDSPSGPLFLRNTIIANSTPAADCTVSNILSNVNNLIEDGSCSAGGVNFQTGDPLLGPLADNGGRTPTLALLAGSPALDTADSATCPPTDQRGVSRPQGAACDRGAYEAAPDLTLTKSVVPVAPLYHGSVTYTVNLTNSGIVTDANVLFTDVLPTSVAFGAWLEQPAGAVAAGNAITWTGALLPGGAVTFRFTATHTGAPREWVTNTATFSGAVQTGSASAGFQVTAYVITPTVSAGGNINPSTPQVVDAGADRVFTITPNYGYHILDVGVDGVSVGTVNVYTFTNVTADHTISATFDLNDYALTTNTLGQGQITRTPDRATYLFGSVVTLTAVPQAGWYFGQWTGGASGTLTQTTVLMDANKVVTATFFNVPQTYYTLTLSLSGSGLITPTIGAHMYLSGTVVPLSASPEVGWRFIGWSGHADCADGSVTLNANKSCTATFARYQIYLPLVLKY